MEELRSEGNIVIVKMINKEKSKRATKRTRRRTEGGKNGEAKEAKAQTFGGAHIWRKVNYRGREGLMEEKKRGERGGLWKNKGQETGSE